MNLEKYETKKIKKDDQIFLRSEKYLKISLQNIAKLERKSMNEIALMLLRFASEKYWNSK